MSQHKLLSQSGNVTFSEVIDGNALIMVRGCRSARHFVKPEKRGGERPELCEFV